MSSWRLGSRPRVVNPDSYWLALRGSWWSVSDEPRVTSRTSDYPGCATHYYTRLLEPGCRSPATIQFSELAETFNGLLNRLQSAFEQQARVLEQQRRFTADASHELKTPLTIIKGTTSLTLTGQPIVAVYHAALQEIDRAADTMSHLVQDLLLLARSDGGQSGKDLIELLARDVVDTAISGITGERGLISLDIADETLSVMGNERELVRLLSNVLENAMQHAPSDSIISVSVQTKEKHALIRVRDTGPGIAPEYLPHLGERFYRVDTARSRPEGGTGLGLSICKGIVEAHGGTLGIESTIGSGTTVLIRLPRLQ